MENCESIKTKIEIKSIFGDLIFEFEKENNTIKDTLLEAIKCGADLRGAYLRDAYLRGADLRGADLRGADLRGANLCGAYLRDADLRDAYLRGAYLRDADLRGADLRGADLRDADLRGAYLRDAYLRGAHLRDAYLRDADLRGAHLRDAYLRDANNDIAGKIEDWMSHDNIGSRNSRTLFFKTDKGVFVRCGCFWGDLEKFIKKVKETHGDSKHARDYLALVEFIKIKFDL